MRSAGSKLLFLTLEQDAHALQALCLVPSNCSTIPPRFRDFVQTVREGDWYQLTGHPHRTARGELSLYHSTTHDDPPPTLLAPALHNLPPPPAPPSAASPNSSNSSSSNPRHVDMLTRPAVTQTLRLRHLLEQHMHAFFSDAGFTHVRTPILAGDAGGATARAFQTTATALPSRQLRLRVAPELWLKRLVVGGLDKVYEIGPSFRNEGIDATHNPEFTTCEFYAAFATLDDLLSTTENLLTSLHAVLEPPKHTHLCALPPCPIAFTAPFPRLPFLPTLEAHLQQGPLPDLTADTPATRAALAALLTQRDRPLPSPPSLPRLLDALAAAVLEPLCAAPTFITHHPAALSPLAKHLRCPRTGQLVAARAELFIAGREYANMYEEENSPFAPGEVCGAAGETARR